MKHARSLSFVTRTATTLAVALTLWSAAPRQAAAEADHETLEVAAAAIPVGSLGLTFLIADVVYFGLDRPMPVGWAVPELVAGVVEIAFGVTAFAVMAGPTNATTLLGTLGALGVGMGAWHVGHAIACLVIGQDPPEEPTVHMSFAPSLGGGVATLFGQF